VNTTYRPEPVPIDLPGEPAIRLIPLGGLGEIGLNMMLISPVRTILAVDCGLLFPDDEMPAWTSRSDFAYLRERRDAFRAVVLTGHEDHIGALSYLLREFPVPVYGTPLTLAIGATGSPRTGCSSRPTCRLRAGGPARDRELHGRADPRAHSIADGIGLAIETPIGTVVHTATSSSTGNRSTSSSRTYSRFAALAAGRARALL